MSHLAAGLGPCRMVHYTVLFQIRMTPPPEHLAHRRLQTAPAVGEYTYVQNVFSVVYYSTNHLENARGFSAFPPSIFLLTQNLNAIWFYFQRILILFFVIFTKNLAFPAAFQVFRFFLLFIFCILRHIFVCPRRIFRQNVSFWFSFAILPKMSTGSLIFHPFPDTTACQLLFFMLR